MSYLLAIAMRWLPSPIKRVIGCRLLGWDIHPTAHIGRSIIQVGHLSMGPGASIGPRNVIRGLETLRLGEGANIAERNHIVGWPLSATVFPHAPNRDPSLVLGDHALLTIGHVVDCADRVEIGDHAALAGFNCQVLTHSLNLVRDRQETGPVQIGDHAAVMSGCILLSGTRVPARSIVSAGSVVTTPLTEELTFYRGNPAEAVRELPATLQFFARGTDAYRSTLLPHQHAAPPPVVEPQLAFRQ